MIKLEQGKLLSTFPGFVESWNAIVDFIQNLRGDGDLNPALGAIQVDRRNPAFPLIRYTGAAGGVAGEVVEVDGTGCWCIIESEGGERYFGNTYYKAGERVYIMSGSYTASYASCIVALRINAASPGSASIVTYPSASDLADASADPAYVIKPLYTFGSEGEVVTDWRNIPEAQVVEVL